MKTILAAAALAALSLAGTVHAQVAKVNGVAIPQQRLDYFVRHFVSQGRPDTPELRKMILDNLITQELFAQEARRRGLDKTPEIEAQLEFSRQEVLANALVRDAMKGSQISEDMVKKEYERLKTQLGGREYKVRHILVEKEDEAKEIIVLIKGGGSFEKIAAERSKDTGTRSRGGELDWGPASRYVKPFGDAIARLKKGQMTDTPVQTNFGWHVIRLDDERATSVPPFDSVKQNIQQQLQQRATRQTVDKLLADLRAKAKIE